MDFSSWISIGSLLVALAAVVVGPLVTLRVARHQTMAPMRLKRIEDLRESLAEIMSLALFVNVYFPQLKSIERLEYSKALTSSFRKIQLLLTPDKGIHNTFINKLDEMMDIALTENFSTDELVKYQDQIAQMSKEILAEQWEKIKEGK